MLFVLDRKPTLFIALLLGLFGLREVVLTWGKREDFDFWFGNANECWRIRLVCVSFFLCVCCFLCFLCVFSLFCNELIHLVNDRNLMLLQNRLLKLYAFLSHLLRLLFLFKRRITLYFFLLILLFLVLIYLCLGHIFQSSFQCLADDRPLPKITTSYLFNRLAW